VSPPAPSNARQVVGLPVVPRFRRARAHRVLGFLAPEVACERAFRQRACRPSWRRLPYRASLLAPAGEPASSRGVRGHPAVTRRIPAVRPSTDISAAHPLPVTCATFGLEATSLEVLFRPRGFSPPRRVSPRDGSQVCCTLQPVLGFAAFRIVKSVSQFREPPLRRDHPPKDTTTPTAVTRSLAPDAPLAFFLDPSPCSLAGSMMSRRGRRLRGLDPWEDARWGRALRLHDHRVPSWASLLFEVRRNRVSAVSPVTRVEDRERPPPLTGCPGRLASCRLRRVRGSRLAGESSRPP